MCLNNLDNLNKNLDKTKSRMKMLHFKNLNQDKKASLNSRENLDRFKKIVFARLKNTFI
jgi:hypothetical protein